MDRVAGVGVGGVTGGVLGGFTGSVQDNNTGYFLLLTDVGIISPAWFATPALATSACFLVPSSIATID